jgi:hypothetical protein
MKYLEKLAAVILIAFTAFIVYMAYELNADCNAQGGQYVRGLLGYVCVGVKR